MSDDEESTQQTVDDDVSIDPSADDEKHFVADRAKTGRSKCKKCKQCIAADTLRIAKIGVNPFGNGKLNMWHHVPCLFEAFKRQRATTVKIDQVEDIDGWNNLDENDRNEILNFMSDEARSHWNSIKDTTVVLSVSSLKSSSSSSTTPKRKRKASAASADRKSKDNAFRQFRKICALLANESGYLNKTAILREFFKSGSDGKSGFKGDLYLWCKLLLPNIDKRLYNLQSKQLVKIFSKVFDTDQDDMLEYLENGDIAETIAVFFEKSSKCKPAKTSVLTLYEVDEYLDKLSQLSRMVDQTKFFDKLCGVCTTNDLKMLIRLIKHDLRINAGPKPVLDALDEDAYQAFQTSRNLEHVVKQVLSGHHRSSSPSSSSTPTKKVKISISLLTPVLPMLAEACKSMEYAMKKCPNGMYAEVKYDGERVQLHKSGKNFKFFSRSLKPVLPHKVELFQEFIPKAFNDGEDLILDCEVLMVDTKTGKPLPFGTLGVHKKNKFRDAVPCLFVFDCLYFNGESLLNTPLKKRKNVLDSNMKEIKNHIMFSEMEEIHTTAQLEKMLTRVLRLGLEGLVLKDIQGIYEPGKRHWLKMKKDYLLDGSLADSVDLVVLGAWYGTGNKGGMMSVFLMGCYDPDEKYWVTVTKVHGHDDKTLERLQTELSMVKISKDPTKVPSWLKCNKPMIPDFVASNPNKMPVWEISGAEFTKHDVHTANGISIRFPRVTRVRSDKTAKTATTLPELMAIYEMSKKYSDFSLSGKKTLFSSGENSGQPSDQPSEQQSDQPNEQQSDQSNEQQGGLESEQRDDQESVYHESGRQSKQRKKGKSNRITQEEVAQEEIISDYEADYDVQQTVAKTDKLQPEKFCPKTPLPDVFDGMKIYFPDTQKCGKLYRYYVAYGGEVLNLDHCSEATHYVPSFKSQDVLQSAIPVNDQWIWDKIKSLQLHV